MQHRAAICQLDPAQIRDVESSATPTGDPSPPNSPASSGIPFAFALIREKAQQTVPGTASRRTKNRDEFLRAARFMIGAGFHPKANATTLAVAQDVCGRIGNETGLAMYCRDLICERLGLDKSTVRRHMRYLRELGLLVLVSEGSRLNSRRIRGLDGYEGTAAVYGSVVPRVWDHALGHRIQGAGYEARLVGITEAGRERITKAGAVDNPVDDTARAPQSVVVNHDVPADVVDGDGKATREARADKQPARKTIKGRPVTAAMYAAADRLARWLRPLHNWTQRASRGQLSWVLLDLVAEGWSEDRIDSWLRVIAPGVAMRLGWRPDRPHAYIARQLQLEAEAQVYEQELLDGEARRTAPNEAFQKAVQEVGRPAVDGEVRDTVDSFEDLGADALDGLRRQAWWAYKCGDTSLVMAAYEHLGPAETKRLYGDALLRRCLDLTFSDGIRVHA
jgi:DNA-binding transcriptional ArsR family regulator